MELSRFLTELSVCDYFFVTRQESSVAVASVLNAMEGVDEARLSAGARRDFVESVRRVAGISVEDEEVEECRTRLREMYYEGGYYQQQQETMESPKDVRFESVSPVCVSGVVDQGPPHYQSTSHQPQHFFSEHQPHQVAGATASAIGGQDSAFSGGTYQNPSVFRAQEHGAAAFDAAGANVSELPTYCDSRNAPPGRP